MAEIQAEEELRASIEMRAKRDLESVVEEEDNRLKKQQDALEEKLSSMENSMEDLDTKHDVEQTMIDTRNSIIAADAADGAQRHKDQAFLKAKTLKQQ